MGLGEKSQLEPSLCFDEAGGVSDQTKSQSDRLRSHSHVKEHSSDVAETKCAGGRGILCPDAQGLTRPDERQTGRSIQTYDFDSRSCRFCFPRGALEVRARSP